MEPPTVFAHTAPPGWSEPFLRGVARRVARAPRGHGLLIEHRTDRGELAIVTARAGLAAAIREVAASFPGRLDERPRLPSIPPSGDAAERFADLVGESSFAFAEEGDRDRGVDPPEPVPPARVGTLWIATQVHAFPGGDGRLRVRVRFRARGTPPAVSAYLLAHALPVADAVGRDAGAALRVRIGGLGSLRRPRWDDGRLDLVPRGSAIRIAPERLPSCLPSPPALPFPDPETLVRHTVVVGSSGSGKTSLLASIAAGRVRAGTPTVVVDVHGDLAPAVVAAVPPEHRHRLLVVDATRPPEQIAGLAVLGGPGDSEAEASDVVAALKRLSVDGGEVYWGFRLERIFDAFVRLVQEEGGSLLDLAALLTDPRRREASRLTTRRPELGRFLEELPALERRSPEFLWPAAARVAKLQVVPRLGALLAPEGDGIPAAEWVGASGTILFHLPFSTLGPEGSALAATLLTTRMYYAFARSGGPAGTSLKGLFVLDEAHALSSRLVTELIADGRKFGVGAVVATQYPERLAPELRAAAAGAAGSHVVFRVPPAAARSTGAWVGLTAETAERWLPRLPVGHAYVAAPDAPIRSIRVDRPPAPDPDAWRSLGDEAAERFGTGPVGVATSAADGVEETLLLGLLSLGGIDGAVAGDDLFRWVERTTTPLLGTAEASGRLAILLRRGWVRLETAGLALTPAGARAIGIGGDSGAPKGSDEHRAMLVETVRIFARRGLRVELLRQGRFDTRLPDARLRLVEPAPPGASPAEVFDHLARRRSNWLWRRFGGRDVHIEAEVSGAQRPARIRRGWEKARRNGAFALFVVTDAARAARVREVLRRAGAYPKDAEVWTLAGARRIAPPTSSAAAP